MIDSRVKELIRIGDNLFGDRPILLWQAIAENFYPMRADFMYSRLLGDEEAANHLMTSLPVLLCRELADTIPSMMRPRQLTWAELHTTNARLDEDIEARRWMEWATEVIRRAMYDPMSGFVRATKEVDYDWVTFGQGVLLPNLNRTRDGLLYQSFHLRDCAWAEGVNGRPNHVQRDWRPTISQLCSMFPEKVHQSIKDRKEKEPNEKVKCRHIVVPYEQYRYSGNKERGQGDWISFYIDCENETILEEVRQTTLRYVIPRWKTITGSPYSRSPVTEIMLPDARMFQAHARILLEAGEKAVDPEMIAAEEVFRSDFDRRAGGVTWADLEFDQRLGDKFEVLTTDKSGMNVGFEIARMLRDALAEGFYINKINLPPVNLREMTAYETRKRIEEHVRQIAPLFEPVEEDYNAPLMDETFQIMMENGAFGPIESIPEVLRGQEIKFLFRSPLRDTEEESNAARFVEGLQIIQQVAQIDPAQAAVVEIDKAIRDTLAGIRWKSDWIAPIEKVAQLRQQLEQQQEMAAGAQAASIAAEVGQKGGRAMESAQKAGLLEAIAAGGGPAPNQ